MQSIVEVQALKVSRSSDEVQTSNVGHPACRIEIKPDTPEVEDKLWQAYQWNEEIVLRCAVLDAWGSINKVRYDGGGAKVYTLRVSGFAHTNED